eukprot:CAMPEP_0168509264 /NCGR_PEP_ID=MMETSP0405-20121227/664_1 /TAXON_ID=498012 /ORGANISM="Trichosphaerium sp, Strain Am-I-7 wt" /LENGTH=257 /DNA_ID=CAMNT_0008526673 /DNA_START=638 /DNA_END=1408 /DNA_ORIENTATION=+
MILKTVSNAESDLLLQLLPSYVSHCSLNPDTLLPKFYGLFAINRSGIGSSTTRFVVTNNVYSSATHFNPAEKYDLKGSTYGRTATEDDDSRTAPTLKDVDFINKNKKIFLPSSLQAKMESQLYIDCQFLQSNNLMDYSLLVGIDYVTTVGPSGQSHVALPRTREGASCWRLCDGCVCSWNGDEKRTEYVSFGIIDILCEFGKLKRAESFFKGLSRVGGHSAVDASSYANRFYKFITGAVTAQENAPTAPKHSINPFL